jgi:SAM-dependent methyltransferase
MAAPHAGLAPGAAPDQGKAYLKYLDVGYYLRRNIARALALGLQADPGRRVLDLGCGAGYFLLVCRHLGHEVQGLDLGGIPVFDALSRCFGIRRERHRIRQREQLPREACRGCDVITAFAVRFDRTDAARRWGPEDWRFFLADAHALLAPGGRLICRWNAESRARMARGEYRDVFAHAPGLAAWFAGRKGVVLQRVD